MTFKQTYDILICIYYINKEYTINHELSIIKLLLEYPVWDKYKDKLSLQDLTKEVQPVYSVLDNYHRQNEQGISLSVNDLANLLFATSVKDKDYYLGVLDQLKTLEVSSGTTATLINSILSHKQLKEISLAAYDVTEGKMELSKMQDILVKFLSQQEESKKEEQFEFISDDLEELVDGAIKQHGLRWRLSTLNQMLGSLRKGDFGFIFARPETGKTTFLASETTYMAEQLQPDAGPIIWFNNEEQGNKVKLRCYQASLGLNMTQLFADLKGNRDAFMKKTGGKHKIFDSGIIHKNTVEQVCKQYKPSLIIFDQIDKVHGFHNDREDLRLGAMYQWARELAKEYCPVIAVCQADGSGEGQKWLTMGNVANAKTSKQAEADWIIGIGKVADAGYENVRYLHASKNKLIGDSDTLPDMRHGKKECLINPGMARYEDI
ncbi:phage_DnaB, phage replicative helicase, DnaB family [uncultured Caudovirales phage]|uniref:Phage_DnaB, phage replicative helicase, DnaB family n=1 Tax=uncultured Caudovirales phage TaxID=2100421 RepID=A0A6J5T7L7_9CAUD|nr:phage_DnaB, phage replicative helicase, DnaB family [uncultured Caudovirales phage]